jgi:two-component system response regulator RegA
VSDTDTRETILVVDDDSTFAAVLAAALTKRGYRALAAINMDETLRLLRNETPAKAVVDLRLGKTSGLQLLPILTAANPDIRIVVLAGFASLETAAAALRLGATHYLAKPVDADEIVAAFDQPRAL